MSHDRPKERDDIGGGMFLKDPATGLPKYMADKKMVPELDTETVARAMYELWRRDQNKGRQTFLYMSWEDLSDAANDYKGVARTRELWLSLAEATKTNSSMRGLIEAMKLP